MPTTGVPPPAGPPLTPGSLTVVVWPRTIVDKIAQQMATALVALIKRLLLMRVSFLREHLAAWGLLLKQGYGKA
jgi:hypothetical protein